jgi:hypothetical protein
MTPMNPLHFLIESTESFTKLSKSDPAVSLTLGNPNFSNDDLDFLGEYEAICETAVARESGP